MARPQTLVKWFSYWATVREPYTYVTDFKVLSNMCNIGQRKNLDDSHTHNTTFKKDRAHKYPPAIVNMTTSYFCKKQTENRAKNTWELSKFLSTYCVYQVTGKLSDISHKERG